MIVGVGLNCFANHFGGRLETVFMIARVAARCDDDKAALILCFRRVSLGDTPE
jgi:hypothetical protein